MCGEACTGLEGNMFNVGRDRFPRSILHSHISLLSQPKTLFEFGVLSNTWIQHSPVDVIGIGG